MRLMTILKNKKGAALVMTVVAFLIIMTLATSVLVISQNNTKQVATQDQGMDSYYIARSGAEASYQALITTASLLNQFQTGTNTLEDTITFSEGEAVVSVIGFNEGTTRRVRITSTGIYNNNGISRKSILEFDFVGYGNIKWSR